MNVADTETYEVEALIQGEGFSQSFSSRKTFRLKRGSNRVRISQVVRKPKLWWTWDQGEPNLYRAFIRVSLSRDLEVVETGETRFGIREIKVTPDWKFSLNGRAIFPRGTNIIPTQWLSEYSAPKARQDVAMMKKANLNAVRVHAHVNRQEFYGACDEAGLFVWQDFALQWSYEDTVAFTRNACRQIKDMVRQLYNHPSILVWCCHNEPSFNRDKLDPVLARAVKEEDKSRFVDTASDFHYHPYPGWYWNDSVLQDAFGTIGPKTRFYSEFGAQALPEVATLKKTFKPRELWPPDWKKWALHDFQYYQTFNVAKVDPGKSIEEFVANSQKYQARLVKEYIQSIRTRKYDPMNGYFHFMFVDCWPSITWSVVDYFRRPKMGYKALQTASQPLLPIWRLNRSQFNPGDMLNWGGSFLSGLTLVNDYPRGFKGLKVELRVTDPRGRMLYREKNSCNIPADCVVKPFEVQGHFNHTKGFKIPDNAPGGVYQVQVRLWDKAGKPIAQNEQEFKVVPKKLKP